MDLAGRTRVKEYGFALGAVGLSTVLSFLIYPHFDLTNLVMIYLLGTLAVAARGRRGPAALSATLSVLAFDFFFVPPRFSFSVLDTQYLFTFGVMFTAAMVISHLTIRLQEEAEAAREGERRSIWLMEKAKRAEVDAESERLRSALLSSVSHDFRTPLAVMAGSAEALLAREEIRKNPQVRELLENIQAEGERLSRLVQNLLEATRLESGKVTLQKEAYPLEEVLGSALERLERPLGGRAVKTDIPEDLPSVLIDATLFEQVFVNLLENAIRHTPEHGPIDVEAAVEGGAIRISVADRGPGLKLGEEERIFEKFYHEPASPGVGLGLTICRAIVEAHGGTISARNRLGGGAIFCITIPRNHEP